MQTYHFILKLSEGANEQSALNALRDAIKCRVFKTGVEVGTESVLITVVDDQPTLTEREMLEDIQGWVDDTSYADSVELGYGQSH